MSYSPRVCDILQKAGAVEGDTLQVRSDGHDHIDLRLKSLR